MGGKYKYSRRLDQALSSAASMHQGMTVQGGEAEAASETLGLYWVGADHNGSQSVGRVQ